MSLFTDMIVYVENFSPHIKQPLEISEISKITGYKVNTPPQNKLYFSILEPNNLKVEV